MPQRRWAVATTLIVAGVFIAGAVITSLWTPTVPNEAPSAHVASAILNGEIPPDMTDGTDPDTIPRSPYGQECVDQVERPAGAMSLCWEAYREPRESDPTQDYYRLRVYGTFGGASGTGVRWMSVRARLIGDPTSGVFEVWPSGVVEGSCARVPVPFGANELDAATVCGRTEGTTNKDTWSQTVTWTCVGCLSPDHADREIALYEWVALAPGKVPNWEIYADLGS